MKTLPGLFAMASTWAVAAQALGAGCPLELHREYRPGPWPPVILEGSSIREVRGASYLDDEPMPLGSSLTFYRLNEHTSADDPWGIELEVRRSGTLAQLTWSDDGGERGCPIDPCGSFLDFDGGIIPGPPWEVVGYDGSTHEEFAPTLRNDRLEADPTNWGGLVRLPICLPPELASLTVEFDALSVESVWGMYTFTRFLGPDTTAHEVTSLNDSHDGSAMTMELWTQGSGTGETLEAPFEFGAHHHRMTLRDGVVERRIESLATGAVVADFEEEQPGLRLSELHLLEWRVYVTTVNTTWGDNLSITCSW